MRVRSWIVTTLVLAIVQVVLATLMVLQHDALYSDLVRQRISVIAQTTASTFRPILNLGLPISMLRDGDAIVARGLDLDPAIHAIHAVNPAGIVVHSTGEKPATVTPDTREAMRLSDDEVWSLETGETIETGFTIVGNNGATAGAIVVQYPLDRMHEASGKVRQAAMTTAAVVWVASSLLSLLLIYAALSGPRRKLRVLPDAMRRDEPAEKARGSGPLGAEIERVEANLARANRNERAARAALAAPDGALFHASELAVDEQTEAAPPEAPTIARMFVARILPLTAALIVASTLVLGSVVIGSVTRSIETELSARTHLIGTIVSDNVQRALETGLSLDEIVGAEGYFGDMLSRLPEVAYVAVATGRIVIEAGDRIDPYLAPPRERKGVRSHPILHDGQEVAYVVIDIDPRLIAKRFQNAFLDIGVILLVTLLFASETMLLLTNRTLAGPLDRLQRLVAMQSAGDFSYRVILRGGGVLASITRQVSERAAELQRSYDDALRGTSGAARKRIERIGQRYGLSGEARGLRAAASFTDIRLSLFLFAAADELPLAFLPVYTRAADNLWPVIDTNLLISLPLAGYLVAISIASPYARGLSQRFGVRSLFLVAAIPTFVAHIGLGFATTAQEIILWRTVTGAGYALVTLAVQDFVIEVTPRTSRDRTLGMFTLVLFGGIFTGVALGGVLADRLGPENVFLVSALLIATSAGLSHWIMSCDVGKSARLAEPDTTGRIGIALRNPRFAALLFGIAIPTSVVLQAFISYLVAISLDQIGASAAEIGRTLMLFFLAVAGMAPLTGRLIESAKLPPAALALGGAVIAGMSLIPVSLDLARLPMMIAMIGCGIAAGLVRGASVTVAIGLGETELGMVGTTGVLNALRLAERLGSIAGLLLIAGIASTMGLGEATLAVALWCLAGAGLFALVGLRHWLTEPDVPG